MNFTFIGVFGGSEDLDLVFSKKKKKKMRSINKQFLLRKLDSRRDVYLRITGTTLSPQFFNERGKHRRTNIVADRGDNTL